MNTKLIIILISLSGFLVGCGNNQYENNQTGEMDGEEQNHEFEHEAIVLDNGQKWKVDENMMLHIRNMESAVAGFKGSQLSEFKTLSESLTANIDLLTSNCTMTGQAHDEMHKWLLPFIDLTAQFSEVNTEQEAGDLYSSIKNSFDTFNNYFK